MKTPINVVVLAQFALCCAARGAAPDDLLSRNATYHLWGAGHCYTGQEFATGSRVLYDQLPPGHRGLWIEANNASGHYDRFQKQRIVALYDTIRQRCQSVNPSFIFGHSPGTRHLAIIMHGN